MELHHENYEHLISNIVKIYYHTVEKGCNMILQWLRGHCCIFSNCIADVVRSSDNTQSMLIHLSRTDTAKEFCQIARNLTLAL